MLALLLLTSGATLLRHRGGDAFCKTGVASTDGFACCPKVCGACDEQSTACTGGGEAHKADRSCCPAYVTQHERSCDATHPPCALGADYRSPPAAGALLGDDYDGRHAKDDCNEVKQRTAGEASLATDFVAKSGVECANCATKDCRYSSKTFIDIAKACLADEACVGFTAKDVPAAGTSVATPGASKGTPDCLVTKFGAQQQAAGKALYMKVRNQAGATVMGGVFQYHTPEGETAAGAHAAFLLGKAGGGGAELAEVAETLDGVPPEEAAEVLDRADPQDAASVLALVPEDDAVEIVEGLEETTAGAVVLDLPADLEAAVLEGLDADSLVSIIGGGGAATGAQVLDEIGEVDPQLLDETVGNLDVADLTAIINGGSPEDVADIVDAVDPGLLAPAIEAAQPTAIAEVLEDVSDPAVVDAVIDELPAVVADEVEQELRPSCDKKGYEWSEECKKWVTGFGVGSADGWRKELKDQGWSKCQYSSLDKGKNWKGEWGYNCRPMCVCEGVASDNCNSDLAYDKNYEKGKKKAGTVEGQVGRLTSARKNDGVHKNCKK